MFDAITSPRAVRCAHLAGGVASVVIAAALVLPGVVKAAEPTATPTATPTAGTPILPRPVGTFTPSPPVFSDRGLALVVYSGGFVSDLEAAAMYAGASGVWVQDASGTYQLLVARGPVFLNDAFEGAFPPAAAGAPHFPTMMSVTLVK